LDGKEAEGDPLVDTASHLLAVSTHSERREWGGHQDDLAPRRAELLLPGETVAIDQEIGLHQLHWQPYQIHIQTLHFWSNWSRQ
jgi:hypothetical protein